MDGCTMAAESYFASTLIGKILRKIAKEIAYKSGFEEIPNFYKYFKRQTQLTPEQFRNNSN